MSRIALESGPPKNSIAATTQLDPLRTRLVIKTDRRLLLALTFVQSRTLLYFHFIFVVSHVRERQREALDQGVRAFTRDGVRQEA